MKRGKFSLRALRAAASAPQSVVSETPGYGGCSTSRRTGESLHPFHTIWYPPVRKFLCGRRLAAHKTSNGRAFCHLAATAGLCLGAGTLPLLALAEVNVDDLEDTASQAKVDTEEVLREARKGVEDRLKALKPIDAGAALPFLNISAKGKQVSIRFFLSPSCDVSHLIVDMVNHLGSKFDGKGGEMIVNAWDSTVARQMVISPSKQLSPVDRDVIVPQTSARLSTDGSEHSVPLTNSLYVLIFEPLIGDNKATEVEFLKKGYFTSDELDAVFSSFKIAGALDRDSSQEKKSAADSSGERGSIDKSPAGSRWKYRSGIGEGQEGRSPGNRYASRQKPNVVEALESMGVIVYTLDTDESAEQADWDCIAGYHEQKSEIEDTLLLALKQPEVYDTIARGTRKKFESNRPRAILFEGPPGTGKTSCARVLANHVGLPLLYVPLEVVMSKYFGESEKLLASIFNTGNDFPNGAILFLDEIDALAMARDSEMHEASRRMISVLLRQLDGFEQKSRIVVIAATNRKKDLDPALLSRFDTAILFGLPDLATRQEIAAQYAQHLSSTDLASLATVSEGMSGRDIYDICRQAERRWASKVIRGEAGTPAIALPPIQEYIQCAVKRRQNVLDLDPLPSQNFQRASST